MRRRFSKEYKVEAVELARQRGVAEASRSLGVEQSLLYQWKSKLEVEGVEAFGGNGNRSPLEEENRRLRLENEKLSAQIRIVYAESKRGYGSPRITSELKDQGTKCGKNRVARLMKSEGLRAKAARKYKVTTDSKHNKAVAPDLVQRDFTAKAPNQVWVGDITYLHTKEGWVFDAPGSHLSLLYTSETLALHLSLGFSPLHSLSVSHPIPSVLLPPCTLR